MTKATAETTVKPPLLPRNPPVPRQKTRPKPKIVPAHLALRRDLNKAVKNLDSDKFIALIEKITPTLLSKNLDKKGFFSQIILEDYLFKIIRTYHLNPPTKTDDLLKEALQIIGYMYQFNIDHQNFFPLWEIDQDLINALDFIVKTSKKREDTELSLLANDTRFYLQQCLGKHPDYEIISDERSYSDPDKAILKNIKPAINVKKGFGYGDIKDSSDPENIIWEACKILYGTGARENEVTTKYIRPIMQIIAIESAKGGLVINFDHTTRDLEEMSGDKSIVASFQKYHNRINISGKSIESVASNLIHESCHFLDYIFAQGKEVLSLRLNDSYRFDLDLERIRLADPRQGHLLLKQIYSYKDKQIEELLPRALEIILENKEKGLALLREQAPNTLKFIEEEFLPKCHEYFLEALKDRDLLRELSPKESVETSSDSSSIYETTTDLDSPVMARVPLEEFDFKAISHTASPQASPKTPELKFPTPNPDKEWELDDRDGSPEFIAEIKNDFEPLPQAPTIQRRGIGRLLDFESISSNSSELGEEENKETPKNSPPTISLLGSLPLPTLGRTVITPENYDVKSHIFPPTLRASNTKTPEDSPDKVSRPIRFDTLTSPSTKEKS